MRRGMSLIEVLIAASILVTVLLGMGLYQTATMRMNQDHRDRAFAVQKATQMMEEIIALQQQKTELTPQDVAAFADGPARYNYMLTTASTVKNPQDSLSGNPIQGAGYRYVRQIVVTPLESDDNSSQVTVAVFLADTTSNNPSPKPNSRALSVVTDVIRAVPPETVPTDVYDIFLVAPANVLNFWSDPETMRDAINAAVTTLEGANAGLEFRLHWVTRLGSGRDIFYSPLENTSSRSALAADAYVYPGPRNTTDTLPSPAVPGSSFCFDSNLFSNHKLQVSGQITKGASVQDPVESTAWWSTRGGMGLPPNVAPIYVNDSNFAWADAFNNALRYPEEYLKWAKAGSNLDDIPLDLLLEMLAEGKLKNAIVVNCAGSMLPMPPVRNYSDAARVPGDTNNGLDDLKNYWGVDVQSASTVVDGRRARLVTHPLDLHVGVASGVSYSTADTVDLGVFPYLSSNAGVDLAASDGGSDNPFHKARIVLRNIKPYLYPWYTKDNNPEHQVEIDMLTDDYDRGNSPPYKDLPPYRWVRVWPKDTGSPDLGMPNDPYTQNFISQPNYEGTWIGKANGQYLDGDPQWVGPNQNDLVIQLKNFPYCHKPVTYNGTTYGMDTNVLLDGFNYFPDPALPDLSHAWSAGAPRNTARMRILFKLNSGTGDSAKPFTITTTIGDCDKDKVDLNEEPNRSDTYVWVGNDQVPQIEKYQYQGDPRENPYKDVRAAGGYNHYFGNFTSSAYGPATPAGANFANTQAGWGSSGHKAAVDVPALMELWRQALLQGNAVFVNAQGQAFSDFSLGGEFLENVPQALFQSGAGTSLALDDEITGHATLVSDGTWWASPWLGELWPDSEWKDWLDTGTLPTANGYKRYSYAGGSLTLPSGFDGPQPASSLLFDRNESLGAPGSTNDGACAFLNGGAGAGQWAAILPNNGDTGSQTPTYGVNWNTIFRANLAASYLGEFPFFIDSTAASAKTPDWGSGRFGQTGLEWGIFYDGSTVAPGGYYQDAAAGSTGQAIAPIVMKQPATLPTHVGYLVLNTTDPNNDPSDTAALQELSRMTLSEGVQGLLDMADPKFADNMTSKPTSEVIRLQPLVSESTPVAKSTMTGGSAVVTWSTDWKRWDSHYYSTGYTDAAYSALHPPEVFNLKYSEDSGQTWKFINDGKPATAGLFDPTEAVNQSSPGVTYVAGPPESFSLVWHYPNDHGHSLVLRIECYRDKTGYHQVHYSYVNVPLKY